MQLMEIYAPLKEGIAQVGALARNNASWEALRQLSVTASILESFGLDGRVRLDFSLVNSMDYYNGGDFSGLSAQDPIPGLCPAGGMTTSPGRWVRRWGHRVCPLYMGRLEQFFGQDRQYDADVLLTYGPDADLVKLAAFAERLRQEGRSVRCERETGQPLSGALPEKGAVHRRDRPGGGAGMINVALPKGAAGERPMRRWPPPAMTAPAILEKTGSSPLRTRRRASATSGSSPPT